MPKINKIKLSGTSYDIQDSNASKTVTLTQAQYDALADKDPNTFYIISDGEAFDPSEKVDTSAFTAYSASVETALSGKASESDLNTLSGTVTGHTADTTIHVTSSDKATWNAKSDFSGDYNDLDNKPTIPTVPTSNTAFTNDAQYATSGYVDSAVSGKANSSDVYTKSQTSGATQISDALSGKQDTLSAGTNISIVDNVISAEGGGKAISAGTNISVTTGETADTINCTLPLAVGSGSRSLKNVIFGDSVGEASFAMGRGSVTSKGDSSFAFGANVSIDGYGSFGAGVNVNTYNSYETVFGLLNDVSGLTEFACGQNCLSRVVDGSFAGYGNSGNTQFIVGNGKQNVARHNAFEVRQNGDIYIVDTNDTSTSNYWEKPMIKLQDALGGGSTYTAGDGIDITNDVISVSGVSHNSLADGTKMLLRGDVTTNGQNYSNIRFDYYYGTSSNKNNITIKPLTINGESALRTAALSISVVETSAITTSVTSSSTDSQVPSAKAVNDKLGGLSLVKLTQSEYDALSTKDSNTLYVIVN